MLQKLEGFREFRAGGAGGIEPPNKGLADLCLTTWLPRLGGSLTMQHIAVGGRKPVQPSTRRYPPFTIPTTALMSTAAMPRGIRRFQPRFMSWS